MGYKENSRVIDKDRDPTRTHLSDALGYLVWQEGRWGITGGRAAAADLVTNESINREHPEYGREGDVEEIPRSVCGRGAVPGERGGVPDPAAEGTGRGLRGAAGAGVLRELRGIDRGLVRGDAVAAGAGDHCSKGTNAAEEFFGELAEDCDRKGTSLADFFRQQFVNTLVFGRSYVVVDFPRMGGDAGTARKKMQRGGRGRIWWSTRPTTSSTGARTRRELDWVVIRTASLKQAQVTDAEWGNETRWMYYDSENFRIFRKAGEAKQIGLIDEGRHGLATLGQTPLFQMKVTDGLWMLNKAGLLQLEHFNKSNALAGR